MEKGKQTPDTMTLKITEHTTILCWTPDVLQKQEKRSLRLKTVGK